jgi:hypothetical protein
MFLSQTRKSNMHVFVSMYVPTQISYVSADRLCRYVALALQYYLQTIGCETPLFIISGFCNISIQNNQYCKRIRP